MIWKRKVVLFSIASLIYVELSFCQDEVSGNPPQQLQVMQHNLTRHNPIILCQDMQILIEFSFEMQSIGCFHSVNSMIREKNNFNNKWNLNFRLSNATQFNEFF